MKTKNMFRSKEQPPRWTTCGHAHARHGFTLIELLVVVGTVAVLGMMLLPALAGSKPNSQAVQCMHNTRELTRAWLMYASDNQDKLVDRNSWAGLAIMDWTSNPAITNAESLLSGGMATYVKSAALFKCPADIYMNPGVTPGPRIRSVSLNGVLTSIGSGPTVRGEWPGGRVYYGMGTPSGLGACRKMSDLAVPGPANVYVFLDEHADSINDIAFMFDVGSAPSAQYWRDLPAGYHDGGCGISFADGRSEIHRWLERDQTGIGSTRKTIYPVTYTDFWNTACPGSRDYQWLQDRMPYRNK